jgi:iron(III) transport system ATP-binding protein
MSLSLTRTPRSTPGRPVDRGALLVEGVAKRFDGPAVLEDASLQVDAGTICAVLGPSGSGKTTLLRLIAGLEHPDSGSIRVGDEILVDGRGSVPPERRHIGMVFQDWALFPHLTVAENVGFGLGRQPDPERVSEALELVGLTDAGDRLPGTLSGGQQQRVALARALAPGPTVLLLDEPFSNLDVAMRARIRREVHDLLRSTGVTTIFVTHDQEEAFVLGDQVSVMRDGRVVQSATPRDLYTLPADPWVAGFVGDANFLPATASGPVAATEFGEVRLREPRHGPVQALVRPEHLLIEDGTDATVTFVEYYGHDVLVSCRLADGTEVHARSVLADIDEGDRVGLRCLDVATVAFEADSKDS